ncbi:cytosolic endo-beta-N-acetylglucosaminidase-like isoform X2 [Oscarella lobularis]|uniref:cytosolic endo-beta-N-acetylglucosaminidase-like isoform X2 n=1 Tax=Oscarella lobularis TaxID=121494 RepID=UPI0033136664
MDFTIIAAIVAVIIATAYFVQIWTDRRARTPTRISQKTMRHIRLQHHMRPSTDTQLPSNVADSTTEKTRAEQKIAAKPSQKDGDPSEHYREKPREKNIVHVPVDTSTPPIAPVLARPISSLDDLLSWLPGFDSACAPRVALQRRAHADVLHPKLIVCHDMMGGYVSDAHVQGCYPVSDVHYYISHWEMISMFIYFSHHFVTVPPPGWTNCAHKHGVPVLGTIITEWEEGAKICERFLESEWTYRRVVEQLVGVALYYKLDGWLVNIENPIRRDLVSNLRDFVAYLTERMNASIPHSEVIWYDSVTTSGTLKWQNELNDQNSMFFTACNGIFLNYTWTDWTLRNTASRAGPRKNQVYVGIDVFGRGCPGGGGFNSKEALEQIYSHDLSAALFAPSWVYENNDKSKFVQLQEKFWNLLKPHCKHCYGYGELPFVTCFSRGVGSHLSLDGQVSLSNGWFNLSVQDPQPTWLNNCYSLDRDNSSISIHSANITTEDSYSGGHSLSIEGKVKATEKPCRAIARLFSCDFDVTVPLLISYSYKQNNSISNRLDFSLVLHIDCPPTYLALTGNDTENKDEDSSDKRLDEKLVEQYGIARSKTVDATRFRGGNLGSQHYEAYAPLEKCEIIGEEPKNNGWTTSI